MKFIDKRMGLALLSVITMTGCFNSRETTVNNGTQPTPQPTETAKIVIITLTPTSVATHTSSPKPTASQVPTGTKTRTTEPTNTPTRTRTATSVRTATSTIVATNTRPAATETPTFSPTASPTATTALTIVHKIQGVAAPCYNDTQSGGIVIPDSQLQQCASEFATFAATWAFTYGHFGYPNYNAYLHAQGFSVICGAFVDGSDNDAVEVQSLANDYLAGNCVMYALVPQAGMVDTADGQGYLAMLKDEVKTLSGLATSDTTFPGSILAGQDRWELASLQSFFMNHTDFQLVDYMPFYTTATTTVPGALQGLKQTVDAINATYNSSGNRPTAVINGWPKGGSNDLRATPAFSAAYIRGSSDLAIQSGTFISLIYEGASEHWQATPENPEGGSFGICEWNGDTPFIDPTMMSIFQ